MPGDTQAAALALDAADGILTAMIYLGRGAEVIVQARAEGRALTDDELDQTAATRKDAIAALKAAGD